MSVTDSNVMDNKFYCWTQPNATDGWSWPMFLSEPAGSDVLLVTCRSCCCAEALQYIRSTSVQGSGKPHWHLYSYRSLAVHNSFLVAYTFQPYIQTIRLHFSFVHCCLQWQQDPRSQGVAFVSYSIQSSDSQFSIRTQHSCSEYHNTDKRRVKVIVFVHIICHVVI